MRQNRALFLVLVTTLLSGCTAGGVYIPPTLTPLSGKGLAATAVPQENIATIETKWGVITCQLRPDAAPQTVANFRKLANSGWYDGHTFFRVVPGFVIQGGSPDDTAAGDIGYTVPAEIQLKHRPGALAMARTADQVNPTRASSGSQFYITLGETPDLDGAYTVFGYCDGSLEVIRKIQANDVMTRVRVGP